MYFLVHEHWYSESKILDTLLAKHCINTMTFIAIAYKLRGWMLFTVGNSKHQIFFHGFISHSLNQYKRFTTSIFVNNPLKQLQHLIEVRVCAFQDILFMPLRVKGLGDEASYLR